MQRRTLIQAAFAAPLFAAGPARGSALGQTFVDMPKESTMHVLRSLRTVAAFIAFWGLVAVSHAATFVYVSNADSKDISVLQLDPAAGDLLLVQTVPAGGQVMPLAVSPDR